MASNHFPEPAAVTLIASPSISAIARLRHIKPHIFFARGFWVMRHGGYRDYYSTKGKSIRDLQAWFEDWGNR